MNNTNFSSDKSKKDQIFSLLERIELFKNCTEEAKINVVKNCQINEYDIGRPISDGDIIPNSIQIILEGEARLIGKDNNKSITIAKLTKGAIVGLGSILREKSCEQINASTKVITLSINDNCIIELYEKDKFFSEWCQNNILPGEIYSLVKNLVENLPNSSYNAKTIFNAIYSKCFLTKAEKIDSSFINIVSSSNIVDYKIGQIINPEDLIKINPPFKERIISIPKNIYMEIIKGKDLQYDNNDYKNFNYKKDIDSKNKIPEKSNLINEERYQIKNKFELIHANGKTSEAIACLQMIAKVLDIPFRKDSIEKIIKDESERNTKMSIQLLGGLLSMMGLHAGNTKIPSKFGTRIPTPSLLVWGNSFAIALRSDASGLLIASPKDGMILIKPEELEDKFKDYIDLIMVEKSNITPNKNFGLSWFLPSIKKYRGSLVLVLIASFIVQLFGLANPLLIQVIIDKVISQRSLDTLQVLGIALVVVTILGGILGSLRTFLFAETTNRIDTRLGAEVIDHLLRLPLNYFDKRPVGELSSRVGELEKIRDFLTGQALTTLLDAVFSIIYIVVMVIYSWLLTFVALGVVPIQIALTLLGSPIIRKQIRSVANQNAKTQSHLVEILTGVQTVKAQNVETVSRWKWQDIYSGFISRSFDKTITSTALGQTSQVLQQLSQLLVLWIGASLVLKGQMSLGQLIAFRIISGYVTQPLLRLSTLWQSFQELKVSFERLSDIIDTPEESNKSDKGKIPLPEIKGNIYFNDVSFSFQKGSELILNKINLTINQGEFVGIAGQSGSGKSTLMKLIPRLYNLESGKILIDGYDVTKTELYSVRRQIGIVPQEPLLFSGTVGENIAITNPEISGDEIVSAAKIANAHEFIMQLPEGYSTDVGERGSRLSGGQKQRIAIARTLISRPRMLIMDEATSALDYESERKVCENIRKSYKNITVLFITHRLSTIKNATKIVMMHQGTISEIGSHTELMDLKGRYYALYRQQEGI